MTQVKMHGLLCPRCPTDTQLKRFKGKKVFVVVVFDSTSPCTGGGKGGDKAGTEGLGQGEAQLNQIREHGSPVLAVSPEV